MPKAAKYLSRGAVELRAYLEREKLGVNAFADWIGVAPGVASHWISGDRKPDLERALAVAQACGIEPALWLAPSEHRAGRWERARLRTGTEG